jgi:hypothetical protein
VRWSVRLEHRLQLLRRRANNNAWGNHRRTNERGSNKHPNFSGTDESVAYKCTDNPSSNARPDGFADSGTNNCETHGSANVRSNRESHHPVSNERTDHRHADGRANVRCANDRSPDSITYRRPVSDSDDSAVGCSKCSANNGYTHCRPISSTECDSDDSAVGCSKCSANNGHTHCRPISSTECDSDDSAVGCSKCSANNGYTHCRPISSTECDSDSVADGRPVSVSNQRPYSRAIRSANEGADYRGTDTQRGYCRLHPPVRQRSCHLCHLSQSTVPPQLF